MTEGATSVSCLDETIHHKSSLAPDESIELPALRTPSDAHTQEKQPDKVIFIILDLNSCHKNNKEIKERGRGKRIITGSAKVEFTTRFTTNEKKKTNKNLIRFSLVQQ